MANAPAITARATVTSKSLANDSVAKTFSSVHSITFDFDKGVVNVVDATGSFFFGLTLMTSVVDTIVAGVNGQHSFVMS